MPAGKAIGHRHQDSRIRCGSLRAVAKGPGSAQPPARPRLCIVPRNERDQFAGLIGKNYIVLTAEEVASAAGYAGEFPDSWFTQQIIKIIAANIVDHEYYLILDSNTLIGFDFDERHFHLPWASTSMQ